jgi:hypothetical protein
MIEEVQLFDLVLRDGARASIDIDDLGVAKGTIRFNPINNPFAEDGVDVILQLDDDTGGSSSWWLLRIDSRGDIIDREASIETLVLLDDKTPKAVVKPKKIRCSQLKFSTNRDIAIKQAIDSMKKGSYKATAIKVELEADLSRDDDDYDCGTCAEFICEQVSRKTRKHTIFSKFYYDGSVDSEFTVTVDINHPECIIDYINAFNALTEEIGNGADTSGAGMHIAILNSKDGNYPQGNELKTDCNQNFKAAVTPLLPALFFMGSCDYNSRDLGYRAPRVARDKYSAVHANGCYEFRVFETCYKYPDRFYDYLVTIAKCLQFYSPKKVLPSFTGTIGTLGMPSDGDGLGRFYFTYEHVKALDKGLAIIKPSYKSIATLKKERGLKFDVPKLKAIEKSLELTWRNEYKSYKEQQMAARAKFLQESRSAYQTEITNVMIRFNKYISDLNERDALENEQILNWFNDNFGPKHVAIAQHLLDGDLSTAKDLYKLIFTFEEFKRDRAKNAPKPPERGVRLYIKRKKQAHLTRGMTTLTV